MRLYYYTVNYTHSSPLPSLSPGPQANGDVVEYSEPDELSSMAIPGWRADYETPLDAKAKTLSSPYEVPMDAKNEYETPVDAIKTM